MSFTNFNRSLYNVLRTTSVIIPCVFLTAAYANAQSLPEGGAVKAGQATIDTPNNGNMTINQSSKNAIIEWQGFSIGQGKNVQFNNGTGATLNRVIGTGISRIDGNLSATGSLYLINQHGVIVGEEGRIETGGSFVGSTQDIDDADFMDGGDDVFSGSSQASVTNLGSVSSLGGDVAFIAKNVVNKGEISASKGTVGLLSGREILLRDAATDQGKFIVRIGDANGSVEEKGKIDAASVELRANGGNIYALAGNDDGYVKATGVLKRDGRIFLTAKDNDSIVVEKKVSAKTSIHKNGKKLIQLSSEGVRNVVNLNLASEAKLLESDNAKSNLIYVSQPSLEPISGGGYVAALDNIRSALFASTEISKRNLTATIVSDKYYTPESQNTQVNHIQNGDDTNLNISNLDLTRSNKTKSNWNGTMESNGIDATINTTVDLTVSDTIPKRDLFLSTIGGDKTYQGHLNEGENKFPKIEIPAIQISPVLDDKDMQHTDLNHSDVDLTATITKSNLNAFRGSRPAKDSNIALRLSKIVEKTKMSEIKINDLVSVFLDSDQAAAYRKAKSNINLKALPISAVKLDANTISALIVEKGGNDIVHANRAKGSAYLLDIKNEFKPYVNNKIEVENTASDCKSIGGNGCGIFDTSKLTDIIE